MLKYYHKQVGARPPARSRSCGFLKQGETDMKKTSKLLAAALLLAIVVSVFAVLPAFAQAGDTERVFEEYGKILYDMDAQSSISISNVGGTYPAWPVMQKGTEDGQTTWNVTQAGATAGGTDNTQDFWSIGGLGWGIRIRDDAGYGSRTGGSKNTDYLVLDFDVATDSEFIDDIYINTRMLTSGATSYKSGLAASGSGAPKYYPAIGRGDDGRIYVANGDKSNMLTAPIDSGDKWTHITFVYDFHPVTKTTTTTDEETGEEIVETTTTITNNCYVYMNGYYAGTINAFPATTAVLYFMRVQTANDNGVDIVGETKFSNLTLKQFESGYQGKMTEAGMLGSVPLYNIPELQYCVYGAPGNPEGHNRIADIKRGDEIIAVTDPDDLSGNLLDGDIVTVYKNVASLKAAYAVKMVSTPTTTVDETTGEEITTYSDVSANIVWQDENGVKLGEEGSLFRAPAIVDVPSDADWAMITGATLYRSGSNKTLASKASGSWVIYDPLFQASYDCSVASEVVFFADYVAYGVGKSQTVAEGDTTFSDAGVSPTSATGTHIRRSENIVYDLNGYTFTNATLVNHWATTYGGDVTYKNGTINHGACSNMLMMSSTASIGVFDNCTVNIESSTFIDHRAGTVVFKDSTVNVTADDVALVNVKAVGTGDSSVVLDGTTVDTVTNVIHASQTASKVTLDGKEYNQRQGGGTIHTYVTGSTINTGANFFRTETYANGHTHTGASYCANKVEYDIIIEDSDITAYTALVTPAVSSLPNTATTSAGPLVVNTNVEVIDSRINAFVLIYSSSKTDDASVVNMTTVASVVNSDLKLDRTEENGKVTVGGLVQQSDAGSATVNLGEGCLLSNNRAARSGASYIAPTVNYDENCVLANTSNYEGYPYIVTSSYDTYTYELGALGAQEGQSFYWNTAEGEVVDIEKVVPASTLDKVDGVYHYEWNELDAENKAFTTNLVKDYASFSAKTNLTLYDYIHFNLFINKDHYDLLGKYVTVDGGELDSETITLADGQEYYKWQARDIAPAAADENVISLALNISTAYGESVTNKAQEFSVLSYASAKVNSEDEKSANLIKALVKYIATACEIAGDADTAAAALAVLPEGTTFADIDTSAAKTEGISGVEISVKYGDALYLGIKGNASDVFTVSYAGADGDVSVTKTANAEGVAFVAIKACDFAKDITVTRGEESATVNLAGYYLGVGASADLTEEQKAEAQAMVTAIYNYSVAAAAYKATLAN